MFGGTRPPDKKYDPGWNDPPMFSYEAQNAQSKISKPRTLLNKRVAFPLQAPTQTDTGSNIVDPTAPLPPCNPSVLPPPPSKPLTNAEDSSVVTNDTTEHVDHFDADAALELVMSTLNNEIEQLENKEKDKDDIVRRLNVMREMWTDNKFSTDIQQRLHELSKALENNERTRADELQKGLMVDHPQLCSPWMSGVRQILRLRLEALPPPQDVPEPQSKLAPLESIFTPTVTSDEKVE